MRENRKYGLMIQRARIRRKLRDAADRAAMHCKQFAQISVVVQFEHC
jgi:ribonuclease P protein component